MSFGTAMFSRSDEIPVWGCLGEVEYPQKIHRGSIPVQLSDVLLWIDPALPGVFKNSMADANCQIRPPECGAPTTSEDKSGRQTSAGEVS